MTDLRDQLQQTLGKAYRIERELGGGGMSRVFLAVETALGREVVVKVLLPELAAGVSVDRFRREIQLAAVLQHPHIVPVLTAGESAGLPYFTMPYVNGESLRARIVRDGELPVAEAVRILRDVASALAYAHAQGVVHRDIKPDNVLLSHGVAVVTDFGVAKALTVSTGPDSPVPGPGITSHGVTLGTPAYMAPEQVSADPNIDHRVDLYAFGATAYEMLTGEPVFSGRSAQAVLGAHLAALPEPITARRPGLPPLLALIIMRCLEKRPADRPQTANDVMNALDMLTTPSGGTIPLPALRQPGWSQRLWRGLAGGLRQHAVTVAALAVAAGALAWGWSRREPNAPGAGSAETSATPAIPPAESVEPPSEAPPSPPETHSPAATQEEPPRPRPAPAPVTPPTILAREEDALLDRLGQEARSARARAVTAGVADSILLRGDSGLARADSLAARGRIAAAAAQLTRTAALWSDAAAARPEAPSPPAPVTPVAESTPRTAPAPPPAATPPPKTPPPDPAPQIRAVFDQYAAAIESRSVDAIRRTYPGLQPAQAREWEEFFRNVTEVEVELRLAGLQVVGDSAEAHLEGVYVFTDPGTRRTRRESVAFQAALRRTGGGWRIVSLR